MKTNCTRILTLLFLVLNTAAVSAWDKTTTLIIDHTCTDLSQIPEEGIKNAKAELHIAYGHTSHGSQLTTGMNGLVEYKGDLYSYSNGGGENSLDLRDRPFSGANDLGNPDRTSWETATRNYLNNHPETNVIIWSWCGQASSASEANIDTYLNLMIGLEEDYPGVMFVYMTGHLDGRGLEGNLHIRNEQIRNHCRTNNKILYDFADIETYNPDGDYFGDKIPNDNCDYDSDGNGSRDSNWAVEWQKAHPGEWYDCSSAHSQPLNANLKAYAAWWLWAKLAGWSDKPSGIGENNNSPEKTLLFQNYPNPFNSATTIRYCLSEMSNVNLRIYNLAGQTVKTFSHSEIQKGIHTIVWNGKNEQSNFVPSGVYFYQVESFGGRKENKKMLYLK